MVMAESMMADNCWWPMLANHWCSVANHEQLSIHVPLNCGRSHSVALANGGGCNGIITRVILQFQQPLFQCFYRNNHCSPMIFLRPRQPILSYDFSADPGRSPRHVCTFADGSPSTFLAPGVAVRCHELGAGYLL